MAKPKNLGNDTRERLVEIVRRLPVGAKLPPERELCELMGVSRGTLRSAIAELQRAGCVGKLPRQGNIARWRSRIRNIGIVYGNGAAAPFFGIALQVVSGMLELCLKRNVGCLPVFGCDPAYGLEQVFRRHALDGVIWFDPPEKDLPRLAESDELARSVVILPGGASLARNPLKANFIANDNVAIGRIRADFLLRRGLSKIAYFGAEGETLDAFFSLLSEAGRPFDEKLLFRTPSELLTRLPGLLERGRVDGLVSDGPVERYDALFEVLRDVAPAKRPLLLVDPSPGLRSSVETNGFPLPLFVLRRDYRRRGALAVEMLLRALDEGVPQKPEFMTTEIFEVKKTERLEEMK